jgi:hypothetical protein
MPAAPQSGTGAGDACRTAVRNRRRARCRETFPYQKPLCLSVSEAFMPFRIRSLEAFPYQKPLCLSVGRHSVSLGARQLY